MHALRSLGRLALLGMAAGLTLTGCIFSDDGDKAVSKPAVLNPESDLFAQSGQRLYSWTEGLTRSGTTDLIFQTRSVTLTHQGDTLAGSTNLKRIGVSIDSGAVPVAIFSAFGLNPARLQFDTIALPDPGAGLRFPDTPRVGWRLDTTVEELRHVRVLTSVKTIKASGRFQECWVFIDSTYWGNEPVSRATTWVGTHGVARYRREWKPFAYADSPTGTLWREIKAL